MTVVSGAARPLWLGLTIVAILIWPFVIASVRRRSDLRIFVIVPHLLSATGAAIGLTRVAGTMSITGLAPHATAAGLAETFVAPIAGAVMSALLAVFVLVWRGAQEGRRRHGAFAPVLVAAAALSQIAGAATGFWMYSHPRYSELLMRVVRSLVLVNVVILLLAVVAVFLPGRLRATPHQSWFVAIAISSVAAACGFWLFVDKLRLFAIGA